MISRKVIFFNDENSEVLSKTIKGEDVPAIEQKAHKLLLDADERGHKYYNLYLQSFTMPCWK